MAIRPSSHRGNTCAAGINRAFNNIRYEGTDFITNFPSHMNAKQAMQRRYHSEEVRHTCHGRDGFCGFGTHQGSCWPCRTRPANNTFDFVTQQVDQHPSATLTHHDALLACKDYAARTR